MQKEIEIKFHVDDLRALARTLRAAGFRVTTPRTHEMNTLYDLPGEVLRRRKELLRLREYGSSWTLTHKSGSKVGRHSSRRELETGVSDGKKMCEARSFRCVQKGGLIRKSFDMPPVGSTPVKMMTSINPSQWVGIE